MQLRFEQTIDVPRKAVFAFHENPEHLRLLHQSRADFRLLHSDGSVRPGNTVWFETLIAGILPIVLGFEFTWYEPPFRFGERLIHGPFQRFTHLHEFEEVAGGCCVRDILDVALPLQYGGELTMRRLIAPAFERAFSLRAHALTQLAQDGHIA